MTRKGSERKRTFEYLVPRVEVTYFLSINRSYCVVSDHFKYPLIYRIVERGRSLRSNEVLRLQELGTTTKNNLVTLTLPLIPQKGFFLLVTCSFSYETDVKIT